jgi:hypothetical protein
MVNKLCSFLAQKKSLACVNFFFIIKSDWKSYSLREPPTFGSHPSSEQQRTQESRDGNIHYLLTSNPPLKCTKSMDPTFFPIPL